MGARSVTLALLLAIGALGALTFQLGLRLQELTYSDNVLIPQRGQLGLDYAELERYWADLGDGEGELRDQIAELKLRVTELSGEVAYLEVKAEENRYFFYYASLAEQRYGFEDLEEHLLESGWVEGAYEEDVFDCSEMSAYLEWELENEGFNTVIVNGPSPFAEGRHTWLLVETGPGLWTAVDATSCEIIYEDDPHFEGYWAYDQEFESIFEALDRSYEEYNWWEP